MIPRYPLFKPIELSDGTEVAAITRRHPPYSDFNFVSLWSWNTTGACALSTLNGNLVVRLPDYVTGAPQYSFLGDSAVSDTAAELIRRAEDEGLGSTLRLIPETVAHALDRTRHKYEMDMDGSDYILSTARLRNFKGTELQKKRNWVNRFVREHPNHRVEMLDLSSRAVHQTLLDCFELWGDQKGERDVYALAEYRAFQRLLQAADFFPDLYGMGIWVDDRFAAFMVFELVQQRYAMGHFSKADATHSGLTPFLMREVGEFLAARGYENLNYQQDLGLPGLRHSKKSYIPAAYLRKYVVSQRSAASLRPGRSGRPSRLSVPLVSEGVLLGAEPMSLRAPVPSADLLRLAVEEARIESESAPAPPRHSHFVFVGDTDRPEADADVASDHPSRNAG